MGRHVGQGGGQCPAPCPISTNVRYLTVERPTMKNTLLVIILGLSLLPLQSARAQTPAKPQPSSIPTSPSPPSWVFLLETKTQWLLIIKENNGVQDASLSGNSALPFPNRNGDTVANEKSGNFPSHSGNTQSHDQTTSIEAGGKGGTDSGNPTVFEGNTNDIPLEAPTRPSSGGPLNPSSPSS